MSEIYQMLTTLTGIQSSQEVEKTKRLHHCGHNNMTKSKQCS